MALREQLLAVAEELRRRKTAGEKIVSIGEDTLVALRAVVARQSPSAPAAMRPAAVVPFPAQAAEAASRNSISTAPASAARPAPAAALSPSAEAPRSAGPVSTPARGDNSAAGAAMFAETTKKPGLKVGAGQSGVELPPPPAFALLEGDKATRWNGLRDLVLNHPVCLAHVRPGKKAVLGAGSLDAKIFFCADAPGADEELAGEPCLGDAGQLLTKMIKGMGLDRSQVYIGSIMNWRPEMPTPPGVEQMGNRPPSSAELAFCLPFLRAQLEIVRPEVVVALGATAAAGLLGAGSFKTMGEIRGSWRTFAGVPVMVTYHPSYLLRNNSNRAKRTVWEDLLQVMERASLPISDKQRAFFLER